MLGVIKVIKWRNQIVPLYSGRCNSIMNPLGIYIHIPYCLHKCGYCDFNSHAINTQEMESYTQSVLQEMEHYSLRLGKTVPVTSLFLGGGTPTTLPVEHLQDILQRCRELFPMDPDCEITLEANPATIVPGTLDRLRTAGYNRISIGVQSFHADDLQTLDRIHSVEEVHRTVEQAREAGFDNLSLDLMFALPRQSSSRWQDNLQQALSKNPEHLSTYNLTIEHGTAFAKLYKKGQLQLLDEDQQLEQYKQSIQTLTDAGYRHYEISNFAKPGKECRHNITYWQNGETIGIGAGAASYLNGTRAKNYNLPARYIREVQSTGTAIETRETLEPRQAMGETLMVGLRMLKGISIRQFENRFQTSFQKVYGHIVETLLQQNLIRIDRDQLALSEKGLFLADTVILEFIN